MKNRVLTAMGGIMLVGFVTIGFFVFPVGVPLCGITGLVYGIKSKNKKIIKWSLIALFIGIALVVYTFLLIDSM